MTGHRTPRHGRSGAGGGPRVRRVNESLRALVAEAVLELKDPRLGFVTVTEVRTTPDLRTAEVFYTVLPDDAPTRDATAEGLQSAGALLRRRVGERLRMKRIPHLRFTADPVPAAGRRIDALLREDRAGSEDRSGSEEGSGSEDRAG